MMQRRVSIILTSYPTTLFWIAACAAFAAGTLGAYILLVAILIVELVLTIYFVKRMRRGKMRGDK